MTAVALWLLPAGVDDVTRESARQDAVRELLKPAYHHSEPLVVRILRWLARHASDLLGRVSEAAPGGAIGLVGIVGLVVLVAMAVRRRFGPLAAAGRRQAVFDQRRALSSAEHRAEAEAAAAVGEWEVAVRERFRALVRGLEERTVLEPRAGRTADEAAAEAGLALPLAASVLIAAARTFDDVVYGGRAADEPSYRAVVAADDETLTTRPVFA